MDANTLTHHAYCIESRGQEAITALLTLCTNAKLCTADLSTVFVCNVPSITLEDVSKSKEFLSLTTNISSYKKIVIFSSPFFPVVTQNALLKMIEEPTGDTLIFLIVPSRGQLLPTILSRLQDFPYSITSTPTLIAEDFIGMNYTERLEWILKYTDQDDAVSAVYRDGILQLFENIEQYFFKHSELLTPEATRAIEYIYRMKRIGVEQPIALKMTLETLALLLPVSQVEK